MPALRIAVVGIGLGGQSHIRQLADCHAASLDAIVAPLRDYNIKFASTKGVRIFESIGECIRYRKPDGVIIASPNRYHFEHASICIAANIPILLEKPITSDVEEAKALLELISTKRKSVLIGHHRAHNPIIKSAAKFIADGQLGKIVALSGSTLFKKPDSYFLEGEWRRSSGGGPLMINLIHDVDICRRLIGEIAEVSSFTSSQTRGFEVEDTAAVSLRFRNGALGTLILSDVASSSRSWELSSGENPAFPQHVNSECYLVAGTLGTLELPSLRFKYYPHEKCGSWWNPLSEEKISISNQDPMKLQLDNFIAMIRNDSEPLVTALDGYRNLLIIDAIKRSSILGRSVAV